MKRIQEDPDRENQIHDEAVVDAHDAEEQAMGWYYYIEDKLHCPFKAKCISKRIISPLEKGEQIEVRGMAPEEECNKEIFVEIIWEGKNLEEKLRNIKEDAQQGQISKRAARAMIDTLKGYNTLKDKDYAKDKSLEGSLL